ncbi:MAG TPA: NAD(P)H-dependent oxidoreductase subunit E, partial [Gemmatales bacterium]|nr:NAD(P)H-dependent oxidoreductase subunit E [Gemmatales bacterium]
MPASTDSPVSTNGTLFSGPPVLTEAMVQKIKAFIPRYPSKQAVTLPALHIVQDELRCVPPKAIDEIAALLDLQPAEVHDTLSFYGFFRDEHHKLGKHRLWVCRSLPCMLRGGEQLPAHLCEKLHVKPGETTSDQKITLAFAECIVACEQAPCVLVNDEIKGN